MFNITQQAEELERSTTTSTPIPSEGSSYQKLPLATKWGLDQPLSWKLSKEFTTLHPEIDCISGELLFDLSYSAITRV